MDEYKKFFKKVEGNSLRADRRKVSIQNPILRNAQNQTRGTTASKVKLTPSHPRQVAKANLQRTSRPKYSSEEKINGFPLQLVTVLALGFGLCLWLVMDPEGFDHLLSKIEVRVMGEANANASEKSAVTSVEKKEKSSQAQPKTQEVSAAEIKKWSDEEVKFFNNLSEKKAELDQRETNLKQLEEELQKRKEEIEKKLSELEGKRRDIANVLQDRVKTDEERVAKLVQFYSNMKPQNASQILSTLDESLTISILTQMKKQDAASILNFMDAKRAKEISEKFAGYTK